MKTSLEEWHFSCALNAEQEWERDHAGRRKSVCEGADSGRSWKHHRTEAGLAWVCCHGSDKRQKQKCKWKRVKCSVKHLLVSPLLTSHWIKQVTWLDAERVGGHQRSWQSAWLKEGVRYSSHRCDRSTTPALFFFGFLVKEESSSH